MGRKAEKAVLKNQNGNTSMTIPDSATILPDSGSGAGGGKARSKKKGGAEGLNDSTQSSF